MQVRGAAAAFFGVVAVAVAIWLIPASVHVVEWTTDGPHRLGLFASRTSLVAFVLAAASGAGVLYFVGRLHSGSLGWLNLLWLWLLPFLPWLPDRFPLLLVLAGPLRWVVAAVALAGAARQAALARAEFVDTAWRHKPFPLKTARLAVFAGSLAVYLILGALHARAIGPGGDEPHYLVITHSLLTDGDIQIENNHTEGDYRAFWAGPPLRPDYMKRGLNGAIYSIHAPGLSALILPAYAVGGYGGVVAFLCLIAALTALAVFDLAYAVAGALPALTAFAAVALTVPFLPHGWLIYPEIPGALVVAWASLWIWQGSGTAGNVRLAVRGALLAALPWLHTKFILFVAVFGGAMLFQLRRRPAAAAVFAAPVALSVAVWMMFFYVVYGTFNPEAPYGDYPRMFVLMRNIPRGLLGLLFDQKFGLLMYAPVYLAAAGGAWLMLRERERRWLGAVLLTAVAIHVGSTTRLYMWWGGNSAPARFLVPILPCLAAPIAVAVSRWRSPAARAFVWTALMVSLVVAIGGLLDPERLLLFSDPRGKGRIVELLQGPAPLASLLPTFAQEDWRGPLLGLLPWLAAAGLTVGGVLLIQRRPGPSLTPLAAGTCGALIFLASASVLAMSVPEGERHEAARRGAVDVLWRYDPQRLRALDYATLARIDQDGVFTLSRIEVEAGGPPDPTQRIMVGPISLPAGSYQVRIWFAEGSTHDGEVVVSSSERAVYARAGNSVQNPLVVPFQLPFGVRRLTVSASQAAARHAVRAELKPQALVPPAERESRLPRAIEAIPDHPGAFLAYLNEHAYPEGGVFWTRGTGQASVLVAPGGARRLVLTLFSGPSGADCTVSLPEPSQTVKMTPGQTSAVSFAVPPGRGIVPLDVAASAFFRPSEADPASTDTRGLGCQVRIGLE
jgi:hypothetical protein